jgi:hypothetical protein
MPVAEGCAVRRVPEDQGFTSDLPEAEFSQLRFIEATRAEPHQSHGPFPEQVERRIKDSLPEGMSHRMEDGPVKEHDVVRHFLDVQIGPKSVVAVSQDDVGLMKPLRIIVADVEERHPVDEGVGPENLIHRQPTDQIRLGTLLVEGFNANDQMTNVVVLLIARNGRREFAA